MMRRIAQLAMLAALAAGAACAQTRTEYRGFWVDTFNSNLNNHADIVTIVDRAKAATSNVLFVQVRRRGDAWYLNSIEPQPDFVPLETGFDPLFDLIQTAHSKDIEVHAFVIMGAIWNKNPAFTPTASLGTPLSPNHVFNQHGGFDAATGRIEAGPNNWLTRSLLPDGTAGITFQGHRFGSDFWVDFGHPDAATHSVEVVLRLVRNYNLDGIHLDRIRFPDLSAAGQTPATGANIGYNMTSVYRFQERYGIPHDAAPPNPGDALWAQWRRDQVTNVVRRIYLNAIAIRPRIVVSAALIAFGDGPSTEASWRSAEAYWRVYQDWRAWTEEGILDVPIPMNYKRENVAQQAGWYDRWNEWTRNHQYARAAMTGLGVYLNPIEGALSQIRRALQPSAVTGRALTGLTFYSMAVPDTALDDNPLSLPPRQNTPARGYAEFAAALTTGSSADGTTLFEDAVANPVAVFAERGAVPRLAWKTKPERGHAMGYAGRADGAVLDTADVYVYNSEGLAERQGAADGSGFFGFVDLPPGSYAVIVDLLGDRQVSNDFEVRPGEVSIITFPPRSQTLSGTDVSGSARALAPLR